MLNVLSLVHVLRWREFNGINRLDELRLSLTYNPFGAPPVVGHRVCKLLAWVLERHQPDVRASVHMVRQPRL